MKVHELIMTLQQYDQDAEVIATWEGQEEKIDVYQAADNRVIVDADNNHYKTRWQETKCKVCDKQAQGTPFKKEPVCYKHWKTFKEEK